MELQSQVLRWLSIRRAGGEGGKHMRAPALNFLATTRIALKSKLNDPWYNAVLSLRLDAQPRPSSEQCKNKGLFKNV